MKKLLLFFIALTTLSLTKSEAQVTTKIAGDTIKLYQTGTPGNAELILQNSTRSRTNAFLQNRNNGRTQFAYVVDSGWVDLNQIKFRRGPSTISVNLAALISDNDSSYKRGDSLFFRKSNTEIFVGLFSGIDTTSLSNRINLKLNNSDTAAMLLPYQRDRDTTLWDATKTDIINAIAAIPTPGIDATIVADNQLHANRTIDLNRKKISFDGDSRGQIEFFQLKDFYLSVEDTTGMPQIILRGYGDGIGGK